MNYKSLLILFLLFASGGNCYSQNSPGNLYIIDKLLDESFISIENKMTVLGNERLFEIEINQNTPASGYFLNAFRQKFREYKFTVNEKFDSTNYIIIFKNISIKPFYSYTESEDVTGNKMAGRDIKINYNYEIKDINSGKILYQDNIIKSSKDIIDPKQKVQLEDIRYPFTQGKLPNETKVNSYLFPAIIIAVSAASIILFFTIRSN